MAKQALRLLVTSVGSLVAQNLFESLNLLGREQFFVAGTNTLAEAVGNFACDCVQQVPPTQQRETWMQALQAWGNEVRPDLWIPTRDDDVTALAQLAAHAELPGQALVGTPEMAEQLANKWLSYRFAIENGLPVVPTAADEAGGLALADVHGWPLIVKPQCGYGSRGVRLVFETAQLQRLLAQGSWVVQPFVNPEPGWAQGLPDPSMGIPLWYSYRDPGQYAVVVLIGPDGAVTVMGATLNTMVCGRPERSVRADDPALAQVGQAYGQAAAKAGWRGVLNVQCRRLSSGHYQMFELAGRLAGGLGAREVLGIPEFWQVLQAWCPGHIVGPRTTPQAQTPGVALKVLHTGYVHAQDLHIFESEKRWQRKDLPR